MNQAIQKIIKLSSIAQWIVITITSLSLMYILYQQFVLGALAYSDNDIVKTMWSAPEASNVLVGISLSPFLVFIVLSSYWIIRLLNNFKKAEFFTQSSLTFYVAFIWTKLATLIYDMLLSIGLGIWHKALFGSAEIELSIEFGYFTTLMLMGIVAYLLKAAKTIEDENKEFVWYGDYCKFRRRHGHAKS